MSRKIYVGNLPDSANEIELSGKFAEHGKVLGVKMIADRGTGRSLGYAFVEMSTAAEAQCAIDELDGQIYDGWQLTVRSSTPLRDDSGREVRRRRRR